MNKIAGKLCVSNIGTCFNNFKPIKTFLNKPSFFKTCHRHQSNANTMKVTVLGVGGKLGKAVSMMLKQSPLIDELCVHDNEDRLLPGFTSDLNYIDTQCTVTSYCGLKDISQALSKSNVVVVLATASHTSTLTASNLFDKNAVVIKEVATNIAKYSPRSVVAIATEPINSIVPLFSEMMKKQGYYNPYAIFGITTIDVVRANKFVSEVLGIEPECVTVPIIGGHTEKTMVPVLSKASPCSEFTNEELEDITNCVRGAADNLAKIRSSDGAYLSNAFAITRFVLSLVKALRGQSDIVECAYVKSSAHPQLKYMVTPLLLGPNGITKNLGIPELSDYEICLLENAIPLLMEDIKKGEFVGGRPMEMVNGKLEEKALCDPCDPNPKAPRCPPDHCELQSMKNAS